MTRGNALRPDSWRLATRVAVAAMVLLTALLVIVVLIDNEARERRRDDELTRTIEVAEGAAALVDLFASDIESTTLSIAASLAQAEVIDQDTAGRQLAALRAAYPLLRGLFVTDPEGIMLASGTGEWIGMDYSDRPYLAALQAGADSVWTDGLGESQSGLLLAVHGQAIRDDAGTLRGYVLAAIYPPEFMAQVESRMRPDAKLTLIDGEGFALSTGIEELSPGQRLVDRTDVQAALRGELVRVDAAPGLFTPEEERYGAIVPIERTGWALAFTRPDAPLEAALQRDLIEQVALVALGVVSVAALLTLIVQQLTKPMGDLAAAAAAVGRGERPEIPSGQSEPEVRQLADAMRLMTSAVAEREDALRREAERRSSLAEASRAFSASARDVNSALATVASTVCDYLGDGCSILLRDYRGSVTSAALTHRESDPRQRLQLAMPERIPEDGPGITSQVLRTGRPVRYSGLSVDEFAALVSPEFRPIIEEYGAHSISGHPLIAHGHLIGVLVAWRDATPALLTEDDEALLQEIADRASLAIDNARLFREVSEHAENVDRAMEAHREVVALVSHDLKNPLATIKATAQLLKRTIERQGVPPAEELVASLSTVEQASARATAEIEAMLDDAILRAGGTIALNPQDFDLVGALRGLCEDFQKRSPSHALSMLCDEIELFGQWDGPRLERAFSNLLENAVKYSPDGGAVTVRIVRERRVDGGFEAVVQVQDTGVGIPPRALPRIFDRLYRADNVAAAFKGSGLGLTGVRSIVEAHAGTIGVESVEGEGTTFTVRLPCHRVADDGRGDGALEVSGASST